MMETQKTGQESPLEQTNSPTKRRLVTKILVAIGLAGSGYFVGWITAPASMTAGIACSTTTPALANRQFHWSFLRGIVSSYLLWLYTLWADEQNKQYYAVRRHHISQSTEPLRTPRFFWLLPHVQTPFRRALAVVACALVLLLQFLALYFSYKGLWEASSNVLDDTMFRGACIEGTFVRENYLIRWPLGAIASFGVWSAWANAISWTASWLAVQISFVFCLYANEIRYRRRGQISTDQCEKAADGASNFGTKAEAEVISPPIDASSESPKG